MTIDSGSQAMPKPVISRWSEEFWAGLDRGEFLLQNCNECGTLQGYPKPRCKACGSTDLGWLPSSGTATVYSWTTVEANPPTPFIPDLPYTLVIAEMAEGVRILGRCTGAEHMRCGLPLRVDFADRADGVRLPAFVATG